MPLRRLVPLFGVAAAVLLVLSPAPRLAGAQPYHLIQTIPNPVPSPFAEFGYALATLGSSVLVGAPGDSFAPDARGSAVRVDAANGQVLQTYLDPHPAAGDRFGFSIAAVGTKVAVGAPFHGGAVDLFDATTGSLLQTLVSPASGTFDYFGWSIAALGDDLLVGAPGVDTPVGSGAVYLFDGATGALLRTFVSPAMPVGEGLGMAVAAAGPNVLAGAPSRAGVVYLFDAATGAVLRSFGNPTPGPNLLFPDECFGCALAALGDDVVVGNWMDTEETGVDTAGAAYLFDGTSGALLHTFPDPTPVENDFFGYSLAAVGGRIAIAAIGQTSGGANRGAVYVLTTSGSMIPPLFPPFDALVSGFGYAIATLDDSLAIGAPFEYANGAGVGSVYVFTHCGDGVAVLGEECDDGNNVNCDGCSASCRLEPGFACGDGIVLTTCNEECDDGSANSDTLPDACRTTCRLPTCGDGVADAGEQCDDGGRLSCDGCSQDCVLEPGIVCGDGIVEPACHEQCDDANAIVGDGCAPSCKLERIPGGGSPGTECYAEWSVNNPTNVPFLDRRGAVSARQRCVDDDPLCDFDGGTAGSCTFRVRVCANNTDVSACSPPTRLAAWELLRPSAAQAQRAPSLAQVRANFLAAVPAAIVGPSARDLCSDAVAVPVPLRGDPGRYRAGKLVLSARARSYDGGSDKDKLRLDCIPH